VELVKSLGAKEVLDYRSADVRTWVGEEGKKANLVVDCIGGKALEDAWLVVKDGGIFVIVFQPPEQKRHGGCEAKDVKNIFFRHGAKWKTAEWGDEVDGRRKICAGAR
jgi:NADPH:quinone reductase-like Zn-dependent oxidoreductase